MEREELLTDPNQVKIEWGLREEDGSPLLPLRAALPVMVLDQESLEQNRRTTPYQGQTPNPIFQLQGVGLDIDLRDGIFQNMPQLELEIELLGLLTINLVLQPGYDQWQFFKLPISCSQ
jgi:hypothetical protein